LERFKTHISGKLLLFLVFLLGLNTAYSQEITVQGKVKNGFDETYVEFATVFFKGTNISTDSDDNGYFLLKSEWTDGLTLSVNRLGFNDFEIAIDQPENIFLEITLIPEESEVEVVVTENRLKATEMVRERAEELKFLPTASGNFESILPHIALGTRGGTGGELSSQYQVRGGSYDENLVYVNDFEIFRPQLISSSVQEGLSFPNPDMMRDLSFSSGGYEAKYGDKMSSVLDIKYKRPIDFHGSVSASMLGGSLHLEGSKVLGKRDYQRLRYLIGGRYKTTQYLLSSLDTEGQYTPRNSDIQAYVTYDLTKDLQLAAIGNYNRNQFDFVPISRATAVGTFDQLLELNSVFQGRESDEFFTGMAGVSMTYIPERDKNPLFIKLLASRYQGKEFERFDISGFYRLSQVEKDLENGGETEEVAVLGIGTEQQFGRNRLQNRIHNVALRGGIELQPSSGTGPLHFLQWGLKYQHEMMDDNLNEWIRIDSAGFSIPFDEDQVLVWQVLKSENVIESNRLSGYLQNSIDFQNQKTEFKLNAGIRVAHWSLNNETIFSPRGQLLIKPKNADTRVSYKVAGGVYHQAPFYRELRRPDGTLNTDLKSQKSIHALAGLTYDFYWKQISQKPFKIISELYYKKYSNLTSYDIDDVRIRYSGENDATGYAAGIDFRLNGAFVPGTESWLNVSLLRTRENLTDVEHLQVKNGEISEAKNVPRPTDQLFNASLFFHR